MQVEAQWLVLYYYLAGCYVKPWVDNMKYESNVVFLLKYKFKYRLNSCSVKHR